MAEFMDNGGGGGGGGGGGFGIPDPFGPISAFVDAGATMGAAALQYQGVQATNAANIQMAADANRLEKQLQLRGQKFNAAQALMQRQFEERLSNTAYQRGTADMRAAGINPMVAFMKGGASTPGGASASSPGASAHKATVENAMGAAVGTAVQVRGLLKDLEAKTAGISLDRAATKAKEAEAEYNSNSAALAATNLKKAQAELPAVAAESKLRKKTADIDEKWAEGDAYLNRLGGVAGTLGTTAKMLREAIGKDRKEKEGRERRRTFDDWLKGTNRMPNAIPGD
ncbi:MAG: putative minor capsid protein [Microviridae sp. ctOsc38]|nr:MAG: putative minor capsid protein [Microviridae sp. ctOsc38]